MAAAILSQPITNRPPPPAFLSVRHTACGVTTSAAAASASASAAAPHQPTSSDSFSASSSWLADVRAARGGAPLVAASTSSSLGMPHLPPAASAAGDAARVEPELREIYADRQRRALERYARADAARSTSPAGAGSSGATTADAAPAAWQSTWQQMMSTHTEPTPVAADAADPVARRDTSRSPSRRVAVPCHPPPSRGNRRSITADALTSDSDDASSADTSSDDDRYSTECAACDRHIARSDGGFACDVAGCRSTKCTACMPSAGEYLCRQHATQLGAVVAASADAPARLAVAAPTPSSPAVLIRALPEVLSDAARTGVHAALASVGGWADDKDMVDLVDDLTDTLQHGPASTGAKGTSAITRLSEYLRVSPSPLRQALATHDSIDILLSSFVNARLRVGVRRNMIIPEPWTARPVPDPTSVKSEVSALLGLMRLAALLPADPRGTVPRTRRVMRKCGCLARHGASPRSYTFLWELQAAWRHGAIPRNDPTAIAVATLCVTAIHFLLRPRYARAVAPAQLTRDGPPPSKGWLLRWEHGDKSRQPHLGPALPPSGDAREQPPAKSSTPRHGHPSMRTLHPKHPRVSAAEGELLTELQCAWRSLRGDDAGPLFCRVEPARQTKKVPPGAVLRTWSLNNGQSVPSFLWLKSQMSERIIKRWMVRFLTPIIGASRTSRRVISGLRGGGEMELVELHAPVSVRATIGWWVARRVSAEGALVTYEGSSVEAMRGWSAKLGTLPIVTLAPGVFRFAKCIARSVRARRSYATRIAAATRLHPAPAV